MKNMTKLFVILLVSVIVAGGCQKDTEVGSKDLLDIKEQEAGKRLGEFVESPEPPGGKQGALGSSPSPEPTQAEQPKIETLEIALTKDTPYYQPGPTIRVSAGTPIRFVNKDDNPRQPYTEGGPYAAPVLQPGESFEFTTKAKGAWALGDEKCPFCTGRLEVT